MNGLIIGQSNGSRLSNGSAIGERALADLLSMSLGEPVNIINAAVGASGLVAVGRTGCWLDAGAGSIYEAMLSDVRSLEIDFVVWIGGETDASFGVSAADHEAGIAELFARLRADFGDVPGYILPLILRPSVVAEIRTAQFAYCESDPLAAVVDVPQELGAENLKHFHQASYSVIGDAIAREILSDLGAFPARTPTLGTAAADTMKGTGGPDRLYASSGADALHGAGGIDVMLGEPGNDSLYGGRRSDLISGGSDDDFLSGGRGNDGVFGDAGDDSLTGGAGKDTMNGGAGRDTMDGGPGDDIFHVQGADIILAFSAGDRIAVSNRIEEVRYVDGRIYGDGSILAILCGAPELDEGWLL